MTNTHNGRKPMRNLALTTAFLTTTALAAPALADGHLKITEQPLELTIHMHWPRAQGYMVPKTNEI